MNEEFKKLLEDWGQNVVNKMTKVLVDNGKVATKDLIDSLKFEITEDGIKFLVKDYGQYIESGTRDRWIPANIMSNGKPLVTGFKRWAEAKGISKMVTRYANIEEAIKKGKRRALHVNQQKPVKFFTSVIEDSIDELYPDLEGWMIQFIEGRLKLLEQKNS